MSSVCGLRSGDARHLLEVIGETYFPVDVTITSPPYWNQKDYDSPQQIGFGQTRQDFLTDLGSVLQQCLHLTKKTGSLWLIVDDFWVRRVLQMLPFEIAQCAQSAGWVLRDMIVWDKGHDLPYHAKGQMRHVSELIFFFTKTKSTEFKFEIDRIKTLDGLSKWWVDFPERFNPKGKTPTNVWQIPVRTQGTWRKPSGLDHHCPFPTELVARIIELTTDPGDVVLDPFAGSGVVLAVAEAMGRQFVGCEVNPAYIEMYQQTVRGQVAEEWKEIQEWQRRHTAALIDFEQTILKLRALKFARQVTRPLKGALTPENFSSVHSIICTAKIPEEFQPGLRFKVEVSIVVNGNKEDYSKAIEVVKTRALRPPLTQYNISSVISLEQRDSFALSLNGLADQKYFLYPKHQTRRSFDNAPLQDWLSQNSLDSYKFEDRVPLLSNIDVDVEWALQ